MATTQYSSNLETALSQAIQNKDVAKVQEIISKTSTASSGTKASTINNDAKSYMTAVGVYVQPTTTTTTSKPATTTTTTQAPVATQIATASTSTTAPKPTTTVSSATPTTSSSTSTQYSNNLATALQQAIQNKDVAKVQEILSKTSSAQNGTAESNVYNDAKAWMLAVGVYVNSATPTPTQTQAQAPIQAQTKIETPTPIQTPVTTAPKQTTPGYGDVPTVPTAMNVGINVPVTTYEKQTGTAQPVPATNQNVNVGANNTVSVVPKIINTNLTPYQPTATQEQKTQGYATPINESGNGSNKYSPTSYGTTGTAKPTVPIPTYKQSNTSLPTYAQGNQTAPGYTATNTQLPTMQKSTMAMPTYAQGNQTAPGYTATNTQLPTMQKSTMAMPTYTQGNQTAPGYNAKNTTLPTMQKSTMAMQTYTAPTSTFNAGNFANEQNKYINDLYTAQEAAKIAALEKSRQQSLSKLDTEQGKIQPMYTQQKNQLAGQNAQQAKNFAEYMAERGQTNSGYAAQADMLNRMTLQRGLGDIGLQESNAMAEIARQRTLAEQSYLNDVQSAKNQVASDRANALLNASIKSGDLAYQQSRDAQSDYNTQYSANTDNYWKQQAQDTNMYNTQLQNYWNQQNQDMNLYDKQLQNYWNQQDQNMNLYNTQLQNYWNQQDQDMTMYDKQLQNYWNKENQNMNLYDKQLQNYWNQQDQNMNLYDTQLQNYWKQQDQDTNAYNTQLQNYWKQQDQNMNLYNTQLQNYWNQQDQNVNLYDKQLQNYWNQQNQDVSMYNTQLQNYWKQLENDQTMNQLEYERNRQAQQDYVKSITGLGSQFDYQAEINKIMNDNDTTNDWKIPFLQQQREAKIQENMQKEIATISQYNSDYMAEIQRRMATPDKADDALIPYLNMAREQKLNEMKQTDAKATQAQKEYAMELWKQLGVADQGISSILGIPVGTTTQDYLQTQYDLSKPYYNPNTGTTSGNAANQNTVNLNDIQSSLNNVVSGLQKDGVTTGSTNYVSSIFKKIMNQNLDEPTKDALMKQYTGYSYNDAVGIANYQEVINAVKNNQITSKDAYNDLTTRKQYWVDKLGQKYYDDLVNRYKQ